MAGALTKPAFEWTLDDVQAVVAGRIPEGQRVEYKEQLNLETAKEKAELAKDVSGMANAQGGTILFGVREDGSEEPLPIEVTPLPAAGLQTVAENVLDTAVAPRMDYSMHTIEADGGVVIVVRVAPLAGRPHMVQGYRQNRYFVRRGTRTVPMGSQR